MKKCFLLLFLLLIFQNTYAQDLPAKPSVECHAQNCALKLQVKNGWKIYAHDENSPESLNFYSENEFIKIDWNQVKTKQENVHGIEVKYYVSDSAIPFIFEKNNFTLHIKYAACKDYCGIFQDTVYYNSNGFLSILLFAILGGFILNFMPCVLPVVSMKAMYIAKKQKENLKAIKLEVLAIFLGILTSFGLLAMFTIFMKNLGQAVGWGLHFQEPIFVGILAALTAIFTLNMIGIYEFHTPNFIAKILNKKRNVTLLSDFLHGIFLVLLATPCTAPFLGTAVAFCLSQSSVYIFTIYVAIGFGLGMPYLVMFFNPKFLKILPKPGVWMERLKLLFAIPLAATSIWMFYVLYNQTNNLYVIIGLLSLCGIILLKNKYRLIVIPIIAGMYFFSPTKSNVSLTDFKVERIANEVNMGRTVLVNITSDWCLTCKVNEKRVFSDEFIMRELTNNDTVMIIGDYTSNSRIISDYIASQNRSGIPLSVVYGPSEPNGIVLPVIFSKNDLLSAINKARKKS